MPENRRPCRDKPGFLEPADAPADWHLTAEAVSARTMCGYCPARAVCATEALAAAWTPDGVIQAGIVCRGDANTRTELEQVAGISAPDENTDAVVIDLDAHRAEHCRKCNRRMVPRGTDRGPDEAFRGGRGYCQTCHGTARASGELRLAEKVERASEEHCEGCKSPMVPRYSEVPAGKVMRRSRGLCTACYCRRSRELRKAA